MSHHRRIACSFRDQSLLQIFRISLTSLCQLKDDGNILTFALEWYLWCVCFFTEFLLMDLLVTYELTFLLMDYLDLLLLFTFRVYP